MRLNLKKITIDNIFSIGHIEMAIGSQGVTLIEGRNMSDASLEANGAGKSATIGSIFYAIYGHFPSKNGAKADAVVNRKVGKKARVELEFEKGGHNYRIIRSRKPTLLEFYCDDVNLTTNSASNTEKVIQSAVGISEELFSNAILFDSINTHRFALMNDKERKALFTELLSLDLYQRAHEMVKEDLKDNEQNLAGMKQQLGAKENELVFFQGQESQNKSAQEQYEQRLFGAKKALEEAEAGFNPQEEESTAILIKALREELDGLSTPPLQSNSQQAYQDLMVNNQKLSQVQAEINNIRQQADSLQSQKLRFEQSDLCPTCGNEMDEAHKKQEIAKIMDEVTNIIPKATELSAQQQEYTSLVPSLQEAYNKEQQVENEWRAKQSEVTQEVSRINAEITKVTMAQQSKKTAINHAREMYEYALNNKPVVQDVTENIATLEKSIATIKESVLTLTDKISKMTATVNVYSDKGVKSHLIDGAVPFINTRISAYLATLTGSTISVKLTTQKELTTGDKSDKIDLQVDNKTGADSYNSLSAGEKRRVDIAISLALQDLVMQKSNLQVNALFYDEVFENLDSVGCENVIELLKNRLEVAESIFVITHNESLKPLFNSTMTIVKENGFSSLEQASGKEEKALEN